MAVLHFWSSLEDEMKDKRALRLSDLRCLLSVLLGIFGSYSLLSTLSLPSLALPPASWYLKAGNSNPSYYLLRQVAHLNAIELLNFTVKYLQPLSSGSVVKD